MMKYHLISVCCLSALWLAACTTSPTTTSPESGNAQVSAPVVKDSVTGTVAYRERMALPPAAVVRLQLQDVSRQDVAATIIDSVTIRPNGKQVPISFTLRYDPARIQENSTYAVQARITVDGNLLFINDVSYPVITRGNSKQVQMMLRRAQ
jgi:putative lipoprotein